MYALISGFTYIFGIALLLFGIATIVTRKASLPTSENSDESRIIEGVPAVLIGVLQITGGLYLIPVFRSQIVALNGLTIALGASAIAIGISTLISRKVLLSRSADDDEVSEKSGFTAVLIGVSELAIGVWLIWF